MRSGLLFASTALATTTIIASAAPGDLDTTFVPTFNAAVKTVAVQPDGGILVGGAFTVVNGQSKLGTARLNAAGTLDTSFTASVNSPVNSINLQADGKMFLTGSFSTVNATSRTGIARVGTTGAIDTTFVPGTALATNSISEQNGRYIIGTAGGLFRLNSNGAKDTVFFNEYAYGSVVNTMVMPNLGILMSGSFAITTTGVSHDYLERLGPSGEADLTFKNPVLDGQLFAMALQTDGKILVAGEFLGVSSTNGTVVTTIPQGGLARLNADGTVDASFRPVITNLANAAVDRTTVTCVAVQGDGKILIGGDFLRVSSTTGTTTTTLDRRGIARLNPDGTVDSTFNAKIASAAYLVEGITLLANGEILINGAFGAFNTPTVVARAGLARLKNDPIGGDIRALNSNTIRWVPAGSTPAAQEVKFQYGSTAAGPWVTIESIALRVSSGWEASFPIPLPASCFLRAQSRVAGGLNSSSIGIVHSGAFKYPIQKVAIAPASGSNIANGGTTPLNYVGVGAPRDFPFLEKNTGTGNLTNVSFTFTGTNAADFSISTPPTPPIAGPLGSSPFNIRFSPSSLGPKTATLSIATNDPEVPVYTVNLTGTGVTQPEGWRYQYFGQLENTGNAADAADPDGDGQTNLFEYVSGSIPTDKASKFTQQVDVSTGSAKLTFSPRLTSRDYLVETSTTLQATDWSEATGTNEDNLTVRTFTDAAAALEPKRFYRVKITKP